MESKKKVPLKMESFFYQHFVLVNNLLLHYYCVLSLDIASGDCLHCFAKECCILEADNLQHLRFCSGRTLYQHLLHAWRNSYGLQLFAIFHLENKSKSLLQHKDIIGEITYSVPIIYNK